MSQDRAQALAGIAEARAAGARLKPCCELVGLDVRTVQRWLRSEVPSDQRRGPLSSPKNKLTPQERAAIVAVATSPTYRGMSPNQIVPLLADNNVYLGSESTFYRVLREHGLQQHRSNAQPATRNRPEPLVATGPNQVWSWDITYLRGPIKGQFYYLYMFLDVWSRKIVGWRVESHESSEKAAELMARICAIEGVSPGQISLHSDNGSPMKGATMLATLQGLGVVASFSRPSVSNDNPYSEALFRTLKYRPGYPSKPFECLEVAQAWIEGFIDWYNERHLHSSIRYVTPSDRHSGADVAVLARRCKVYERARANHPERWASQCRDWSRPAVVALNPHDSAKPRREAA